MDNTQQIIMGSIKRRIEKHVLQRDVEKLKIYLSPNYSREIHEEIYTALSRIPCRASLEALIEGYENLPVDNGQSRAVIADSMAKIYETLGEGSLQVSADLQGVGLVSDMIPKYSKSSNITA